MTNLAVADQRRHLAIETVCWGSGTRDYPRSRPRPDLRRVSRMGSRDRSTASEQIRKAQGSSENDGLGQATHKNSRKSIRALTLRDLLRKLHGLRDRVLSGLDRALDRGVGVTAVHVSHCNRWLQGSQNADESTGRDHWSTQMETVDIRDTRSQLFRHSRLLAHVEALLKELDQAKLDSHVGVGTFLHVLSALSHLAPASSSSFQVRHCGIAVDIRVLVTERPETRA